MQIMDFNIGCLRGLKDRELSTLCVIMLTYFIYKEKNMALENLTAQNFEEKVSSSDIYS